MPCGFVRDGVRPVTSPSRWSVSPGRTGAIQRSSSTPIPIRGWGPNGRIWTARFMAIAAVCHPEAARPLNAVFAAAASSRCIGCGSYSAAKRLMSPSVICTFPLLKRIPNARSSNHSIIVCSFKRICMGQLDGSESRRSDADRIPRHHVAIEGDAQFRDPALCLEVDVVESEALFVAEDPFEIVHQAPEEIAADRHALRRRALQLPEIIAQIHDAIEVVDLAVGMKLVFRRGAVLADVDRLDIPDLRRQTRSPVDRL